MPVYEPAADEATLRSRLADPGGFLVACLCAAWCGTCTEYLPKFTELAERFPRHSFAWVDIEEHPELLGDHDVEDFPTLLIQTPDATLFFGPMLPHIGHLERLLESLDAGPAADTASEAPPVRQLLAQA